MSLKAPAPTDPGEMAAATALMEIAATMNAVLGVEPRKPDLVVAEWQGRRWATVPVQKSGWLHLVLPEQAPERFTVEFDSSVGDGWLRFAIVDHDWTTSVDFGWTDWANAPNPGEGWLDVRIYVLSAEVRGSEVR